MISKDKWQRYIKKLADIDEHAGDLMRQYIEANGLQDNNALIDYAFGLATKYGEASAELGCEMVELMAAAQGVEIPPAVPAETATVQEVAKGVMYGKYHSPSQIPNIVSRKVRQAGADTVMKNAIMNNAEWAWVPSGDTCAFCITLASRGWQRASKKVLKGNHVEHIHSNCDCTFALAFNEKGKRQYDSVYDPKKYEDMYYSAEGHTPGDRINAMRRAKYQQNRKYIRKQQNDAYQNRKLAILSQTDGEASIPASMIGNYDGFERLELDRSDRDSLISMHEKAVNNQFEYGQILYDGGQTELMTNEMYDTVKLPVVQTEGENLRVYHSHTNETLPSSADFKPLTLDKVKRIGVISSNGDTWLVEVGDGYRPSETELDQYLETLERSLPFELMDYPEFYEWTPEERSYMLIREKCYRVCREYGWKLMGGSIYDKE